MMVTIFKVCNKIQFYVCLHVICPALFQAEILPLEQVQIIALPCTVIFTPCRRSGSVTRNSRCKERWILKIFTARS